MIFLRAISPSIPNNFKTSLLVLIFFLLILISSFCLIASIGETLLALYGESTYGNVMSSMGGMMIIMLSLVSIGCIIVIYNSFAISVMERKKEFGLLSSIGATKKQIKKSVFYEALVVGVIGIVFGILGAYIGIVELTKASDIIASRTYDYFFPLIIIAIIYFAITLSLTKLFSRIERRLNNVRS